MCATGRETAGPSTALSSGRDYTFFAGKQLETGRRNGCRWSYGSDHPDRSVPGFPAKLHWTRPRVRLSFKERRMKCANATKLHRKSGVAQWRDLLFLCRSHTPFLAQFFFHPQRPD